MIAEGKQEAAETSADDVAPVEDAQTAPVTERLREIGGPKGPEPTRFGDWERAGRCIDF